MKASLSQVSGCDGDEERANQLQQSHSSPSVGAWHIWELMDGRLSAIIWSRIDGLNPVPPVDGRTRSISASADVREGWICGLQFRSGKVRHDFVISSMLILNFRDSPQVQSFQHWPESIDPWCIHLIEPAHVRISSIVRTKWLVHGTWQDDTTNSVKATTLIREAHL